MIASGRASARASPAALSVVAETRRTTGGSPPLSLSTDSRPLVRDPVEGAPPAGRPHAALVEPRARRRTRRPPAPPRPAPPAPRRPPPPTYPWINGPGSPLNDAPTPFAALEFHPGGSR
eukprot:tig00000104_g4814.t1